MRLNHPIRTVSDSNLELGDLSGFATLDLVPLLGGPEPQHIVRGTEYTAFSPDPKQKGLGEWLLLEQ